MPKHFKSNLPYKTTEIPPERTQADISSMLNEFLVMDQDNKRRTGWVEGIRWTEMRTEMPTLEFIVVYELDDIRKEVGVRLQPPMLQMKVRRSGQTVWEPAKAQSMRLLYWYLQAKLQACLFGLRDFTEEFMSDVLVRLPDAKQAVRMAELILPQYNQNKVPALTFKGGD